jgi:hypothetical protein
MDIETLLAHATDDELPAIAAVLRRIAEAPAVVVTVKSGKTSRRYVVATEDESIFDDLSGPLRPESRPGARDSEVEERFGGMGAVLTSFGCRWLRSYGRVDEMHRAISVIEVTKVERIDRRRVFGH